MRKIYLTFALLALSMPCKARTITVDDDGPADFNTIQAAIDDANNGDIVEIQSGTYTGSGNRDIDFLGKAITVKSKYGPDGFVIDCQGLGRGFHFHSQEDANSSVEGLTIINGYAVNGAGIYCNSASPTIKNCRFLNGTATNWGGGIYCYGASAKISDCYFTGNSAREGGAITTRGYCAPLIENCRMSHNVGTLDGGAFNSDIMSDPFVSSCVIMDNRSGTLGGGGIAIWQSAPIVRNCIIVGNYTDGWGSGIHQEYSYADGSRIINCIITQNVGLDNDDKYGIYCSTSKMVVKNSIIGDNIDTYPGDELLMGGDETFAYCDAINSGGSGPDWQSYVIQVKDGGGNIDVPPQFISPGYWDQNGTPDYVLDDFWVNGDYHLKSESGRWDAESGSWMTDGVTSPCIDAGDPNSDWAGELWPHGKRINIGAYGGTAQASMSLSTTGNIADLNNDNLVDYDDFKLFADKWLYEQLLLSEDLDRNGSVDFVDFAVFTENWGDIKPTMPSPIAWWKFDEGEGTIAYDSAGENDGQLVNGPIWTGGRIDGALDFDGANDYVELGDTVKSRLNTNYTVTTWIKVDTLIGNHIVAAYRDTQSQAGQPPLLFQLDQADAGVRFIVADNYQNILFATYSNVLTTGTWYHVAGVRSNNTLNVYVNGASGTPASGALTRAIDSDNLKIGALKCCGSQSISYFFDGIIDDVRIYHWALTAEEIEMLYEEQSR